MLRDTELIGTITVYRQEVRPFTDKQIELLSNFAKQAVIAIENTRLLEGIARRTRSRESCSSRPPPPTCSRSSAARRSICRRCCNTLVESAARLCDADKATITRQKDGEYSIRAEAYGFSDEFMDYVRTFRSYRTAARRSGGLCSKACRSHPRCHRPILTTPYGGAETRRFPHHPRRPDAARRQTDRRHCA